MMYCKYFDDRHDDVLICQVEFEDSSELRVKRDELYSLEEELPKKVKSKMVGTNFEICNLNDRNEFPAIWGIREIFENFFQSGKRWVFSQN